MFDLLSICSRRVGSRRRGVACLSSDIARHGDLVEQSQFSTGSSRKHQSFNALAAVVMEAQSFRDFREVREKWRVIVLKLCLLIFSERIFDSSVDAAIPKDGSRTRGARHPASGFC